MIPVTYPAANVINNENPDISESGLEIGPPVVGQNRAIGASGLNGLSECNKKKHNGGVTLRVVPALGFPFILRPETVTTPKLNENEDFEIEDVTSAARTPIPEFVTNARGMTILKVSTVEKCSQKAEK